MSSLCKAFIERCAPLREPKMLLANKPVGVAAVGAFRNGGQEMTIEQIQAAMLCFGMIAVGGNAPAFQGATVLSTKDDISADELGLDTARKLAAREDELAPLTLVVTNSSLDALVVQAFSTRPELAQRW